jgi:hypothetical protein
MVTDLFDPKSKLKLLGANRASPTRQTRGGTIAEARTPGDMSGLRMKLELKTVTCARNCSARRRHGNKPCRLFGSVTPLR